MFITRVNVASIFSSCSAPFQHLLKPLLRVKIVYDYGLKRDMWFPSCVPYIVTFPKKSAFLIFLKSIKVIIVVIVSGISDTYLHARICIYRNPHFGHTYSIYRSPHYYRT
jgi:hypothetical protein